MTAKFEVGVTYATRASTDYTRIQTWTVTRRTPKMIEILDQGGKTCRVKIQPPYEEGGPEWAYPIGRYSMCPTIAADRTEADYR